MYIFKIGVICMKMYEGVLKRVRQVEEKNGIKYQKPDGKLFTALKVINIISFIWALIMNLLYIAGCLLIYSFEEHKEAFYGYVIPIAVCTVALIVALVLLKFRKYLISGILNVVPSIVMLILFGSISTDTFGFLGLASWYYWRHFAPLALIILTAFFMAYIAIRADYKLKKLYKKVTENIFNQYGNVEDLSDEQWEEFLSNYDHEKFKLQIKEETITENEG